MTGNGSRFCQDLKVIGEKIIENWWRREGYRFDLSDIEDILAENPEVLVVGMGYAGFMEVPKSLQSTLRSLNIRLIAEKTPEAVKTFNQIQSRGQKVAGAFHLTC